MSLVLMAEGSTWKGTQEEWYRLKVALEHNCTCEVHDSTNPNAAMCADCPLRLLTDQNALNRLGYAVTLSEKLLIEEWRKQRRGP